MGIIKLGTVVFVSVVAGSRIGVAVLEKVGGPTHSPEAITAAKATGVVVSFVVLAYLVSKI